EVRPTSESLGKTREISITTCEMAGAPPVPGTERPTNDAELILARVERKKSSPASSSKGAVRGRTGGPIGLFGGRWLERELANAGVPSSMTSEPKMGMGDCWSMCGSPCARGARLNRDTVGLTYNPNRRDNPQETGA